MGDSRLKPEYNMTRLVIMPRDPQCLYAYWEVTPATWAGMEQRFEYGIRNSARPLLRLRTHRAGTTKTLDVNIQITAGNWYVFTPFRGGSWRGELGLLLPDGQFVRLATSNEIQLPLGRVFDFPDDRGSRGELDGAIPVALTEDGRSERSGTSSWAGGLEREKTAS